MGTKQRRDGLLGGPMGTKQRRNGLLGGPMGTKQRRDGLLGGPMGTKQRPCVPCVSARFLEDIHKAEDGSLFLVHACAHNPTGVDPTPGQWERISKAMKEKNHFPFFDMAYQARAAWHCACTASTHAPSSTHD
eukprot:359937-Chlamydomonas_euryale.AAC.23